MRFLPRFTIRAFAVICVAVTSAYVMWMGYRLNETLSSPGWCSKALQAEKISSQNFGGLTACVDLLTIQLKSLALNSHILFGVVAMCLLVLIVIVVAGAKFSGEFKGAHLDVVPAGEPLPVEVTNTPAAPVPTAPVAPPKTQGEAP